MEYDNQHHPDHPYCYQQILDSSEPFGGLPPENTSFPIRMVIIQPNANGPIHFELKCTTWKWELELEALSYVWGPQTSLSKIFSVEGWLEVGTNLSDALQRLRDPVKPRTLWIDKICINQNDDFEKGLQVQAMRQIYAAAKNTIVWLGEPEAPLRPEDEPAMEQATIALAFDFLKRIRPVVQAYVQDKDGEHQKGLPGDHDRADRAMQACSLPERGSIEWEAVGRLLSNGYFIRAWTLQEFVSARDLSFQAGALVLVWEDFAALLFMELMLTGSLSEFLDVSFNRTSSHSITLILYNPGASEAAHNTLRAALHMCLCRETTQNCSNDPDFGDAQLLPLLISTRIRQAIDPRDKVYSLLNISAASQRLFPDYQASIKDCFIRTAKHMLKEWTSLDIFACIDFSSKRSNPHSLPSWVPDWSSAIQGGLNHSFWKRDNTIIAHSFRATGSSKADVTMYPKESKSLGEISPLLGLRGVLYSEVVSFHLCFSRKVVGKVFALKDPVEQVSTAELRAAWESASQLPHYIALDKTIFTTSTGTIGLGPPNLKSGDQVFLLLGGNVPYALRPIKEVGNPGMHYQLLGECLIPEIMHGEGLVAARAAKDPKFKWDGILTAEHETWLGTRERPPFSFNTEEIDYQEVILC